MAKRPHYSISTLDNTPVLCGRSGQPVEMSSKLLRLVVAFTVLVAFAVHAADLRSNARTLLQRQNDTTKWPFLNLQVTIKRRAMEIHGQSTFTMFAIPVVSTDSYRVLYDSFATFTDDSGVYNYTLVDGVAYVSRNSSTESTVTPSVRCLDSEVLPPINSIISSLNGAIAISSASTSSDAILCSSGNLFKISISGTNFVLCTSSSSDFTIYGSNMDIVVETADRPVSILTPMIDSRTNKCETLASSILVTSKGRELLIGQSISLWNVRKLEAAFGFSSLESDSCSCKSTPRPCIFIHGLGIGFEEPENQDSFPRYWGNLTGHTPCCSSVKYTVLDTLNNTWVSPTQQQKVCNRALAVSETSLGSTIANTIIITHSMGGLMMAGAIANGKCNLANTTTWVSLGSPMGGTMGSDFTQDSCGDQTNFIAKKYVDITGRCPASSALKALAYENESYSIKYSSTYGTPDLNAAYKAAQEVYQTHVYAVACSKSYSGLVSKYQWKMWLMGSVIPHKSGKNDGMVEFQSCRGGLPESQFGNTYLDRFYVSKLNHYDLQFKSGDALMSKAKMPVKWLECLL